VSPDEAAWERMLESMRVFFRTLPDATEGARLIERDGVLAGVTPTVPERSIANWVLYEEEDALVGAVDELAATYDEAGVLAWTVWVPEHHQRVRRALEEAGHKLDAGPTAMIASLDEVEAPREDDPQPDATPSIADIAIVNDRAYGTGDSFRRLMGGGTADPRFSYIAREDGEAIATVVSHDHDGDCSMWWVATVPEARGRGLAPGLMRRALHDGRERGCEVTTLQATKLGRPVYERLGYRSFGTIEMWERRKPGLTSPGLGRPAKPRSR
jgi:ribosomal protein S18 acetylase RimI-like enzyme